MAISKIKSAGITADFDNTLTAADLAPDSVATSEIAADAVTSDEIAPNIVLTGGSVSIPSVTTANLPGAVGGANASISAANGMLVYNSTLGMLQQRASGIWSGITTAPVITSFEYSDGPSATAEKTVVGLVSVSCTTQTSTTVLVPGASLGIQVGQRVAGAGIPAGATVVSVIEDTSFVLSSAATASATVTLTFGGVVTITGTNFDSILAGGATNIAVTFDGTSATSISVNAAKTIITCTPPAHAAGTITLQVTNASGLTAETNFIYDIEPIFTTAAGSLGEFDDGSYTANSSAPRIQGTENSVALTSGFARVTSATDDTVITTTVAGLTVQGTGYLTGTLDGDASTTYPFYAIATDDEGQKTAPRLFNIITNVPNTLRPGDGPYVSDSSTVLLIHSDHGDGTYVFTDSSSIGSAITRYGNTHHQTGSINNIGMGASSIYFDSTTDYLSVATNAAHNITGDFTWEFLWYTSDSGASAVVDFRYNGGPSTAWYLDHVNTSSIQYNIGGSGGVGISPSGGVSDSEWHHVAIVRDSSERWYFFWDGVSQTQATGSSDFETDLTTAIAPGTQPLIIGENYPSSAGFGGYLDEIRFSNVARWTSNFTVYLS